MLQAIHARLGYTRALLKLGKFAEALEQLEHVRKSKFAKSFAAPLAIQEAATYTCLGRLSEAIAAQKEVLHAVATEKKFAVASVELLRLLLWAGEEQREKAQSVRQIAMKGGIWTDMRQVWVVFGGLPFFL